MISLFAMEQQPHTLNYDFCLKDKEFFFNINEVKATFPADKFSSEQIQETTKKLVALEVEFVEKSTGVALCEMQQRWLALTIQSAIFAFARDAGLLPDISFKKEPLNEEDPFENSISYH